MAPDELPRVFDRFYRGGGAPAGGSGLGLAIVRRIADLHQATVSLTNVLGGLCATLNMPLAAGRLNGRPQPGAVPASSNASLLSQG
ncbi:MAG: sensor histidine kinase [Herminiimonas sp.]|nr:sensor histidine kinase [Herminiimonas sp.]